MPSDPALSPSATRMRRYRERQDRGDVLISLEVDSDNLKALIEHGLLAETDVNNRAKVSKAVDLLLFALAEGMLEIDFENFDE